MDIIFETEDGGELLIEVGYLDTVLEIKEKIKKYHKIPVANQTLIFNGQVLKDDRDIERCRLLHNSRVQLVMAAVESQEKLAVESEEKPVEVKVDITKQ